MAEFITGYVRWRMDVYLDNFLKYYEIGFVLVCIRNENAQDNKSSDIR